MLADHEQVRDLASHQVEVRRPVVGSYRGFTIMSAPLPSLVSFPSGETYLTA